MCNLYSLFQSSVITVNIRIIPFSSHIKVWMAGNTLHFSLDQLGRHFDSTSSNGWHTIFGRTVWKQPSRPHGEDGEKDRIVRKKGTRYVAFDHIVVALASFLCCQKNYLQIFDMFLFRFRYSEGNRKCEQEAFWTKSDIAAEQTRQRSIKANRKGIVCSETATRFSQESTHAGTMQWSNRKEQETPWMVEKFTSNWRWMANGLCINSKKPSILTQFLTKKHKIVNCEQLIEQWKTSKPNAIQKFSIFRRK